MSRVALVADRATADQGVVAEKLQSTLTSRVLVEQAKGLLAQLGGLEMEQAFQTLRRYSRDHNQRLTEVPRRVVSRDLSAQQVLSYALSNGELPTS